MAVVQARRWPFVSGSGLVTTVMLALLLAADTFGRQDDKSLEATFLVTGGAQRQAYLDLLADFEKRYPHFQVSLRVKGDEAYKRKLDDYLQADDAPGVLYWQANQRLKAVARRGKIAPLDAFWRTHNLEQAFPRWMQDWLTLEGQYYAIPLTYYPWGFFYNKALFRELGLDEPATWEELISAGEKLLSRGVTPFVISTHHDWPVAGWFDFLNLRLHGADFYRQVLDGKVPFDDERLRKTLAYWKALIDRGFFREESGGYDWRAILPRLYHGRVGMTLIGAFALAEISSLKRDDIGFFPFPRIRADLPQYELAPVDVVMVHRRALGRPVVKALLAHMASPEAQALLAGKLQLLPAHQEAPVQASPLLREGAALLRERPVAMQYFDRDTLPAFEKAVMPILAGFLQDPDIEATVQALEQARQSVFGPSAGLTEPRLPE